MSAENPSTEHKLVEVPVILQGQVIFVCRCGTAFRFMSEFNAHKTDIENPNPHPPAWKKIEDIAFASDDEIIDELRCWNELDGALRAIEAKKNRPG
jgi:hypothetical protein